MNFFRIPWSIVVVRVIIIWLKSVSKVNSLAKKLVKGFRACMSFNVKRNFLLAKVNFINFVSLKCSWIALSGC